jgi:hypothetical protein
MNGISIQLEFKQVTKIRKTFESYRVKKDFYKQYDVDAGVISRLFLLNKCSTKTFNKIKQIL